MPLISVIIPCYNSEKWIEEAVNSVTAQSLSDIEVILVNDGSTDNSPHILDRFAQLDNRIKVVTQKNGGLSAARNTGLDKATGRYVVFLDADDILLPGALEMLVRKADETKCQVVVGRPSVNPAIVGSEVKDVAVKTTTGRDYLKDIFYRSGHIAGVWGILFERNLLNGIRFKSAILHEDIEFDGRFYPGIDKVAVVETPVFYYRQHEGSLLHSWKPGRLDLLDITDEIVNRYEVEMPELLAAGRNRRFAGYFSTLGCIYVNAVEAEYSQTVERCYEGIKEERLKALFDPRSRLKVRAGAVVSLFGRKAVRAFCRYFYKR